MDDYTRKIKELVYNKKYVVRRHHIENERVYREIQNADVEMALKNGHCNRVRKETRNLFWRGTDVDGRKLELMLSLLEKNGEETLVVAATEEIKVETAYEPGKDDKETIKEWLDGHPNYEELSNGKGVRRKVPVFKKKK